MNKKIIAAMIAVTLLFVGVFAACKKNPEEEKEAEATRVYADNTEYNFVTDENGEKLLNEDGEFFVYSTDESGEVVTNENGEPATMVQQFVPVKEGNKVEYYGYTITLPEGWDTHTEANKFVNEKDNQQFSVKPVPITEYPDYDSYYAKQKETYEQLVDQEGIEVTWEEDIDFAKGCKNVVRFTMTIKSEEGSGTNVMYFFENNGNLYKLLFESINSENPVADCDEICSAIKFKPYQYFSEEETES